MTYSNQRIATVLERMDLGSSVAEQDRLLEVARVETSVFTDFLNDKIDLIPGTKGSGKTALYRIVVEFLSDSLLMRNKIVIAHGVDRAGDNVFHAYQDEFEHLSENDFVNFWCIYFVSLAYNYFVRGSKYDALLAECASEVDDFERVCARAKIPPFTEKKSMRETLGWILRLLQIISPKLKYNPPGDAGEFQLELFSRTPTTENREESIERELPQYMSSIRNSLESMLRKGSISLWLLVDRLDELFPRRSEVERVALRGLLRTLRIFESDLIRIKVFLRDDILDEVSSGGFTALSHIVGRQSDTLRWSKEQIVDLIVNRLFANDELVELLNVDRDRLRASQDYRFECL